PWWVNFNGINLRANVWVNGVRVATKEDVAGTFRRYEFDITPMVRRGAPNVVAVEVFAPEPRDLGIMWVDWNPTPPDKNLGLWGETYLTDSGPLALRYPHVVSRLELPSLETAHLTVSAEVWNATDQPVEGTLRGTLESTHFAQPVALGPRERRTVTFTPEQFRELNISKPRV